MSGTTNINILMDSDLIDISLHQPNRQTISALLEAEKIVNDPTIKGYTDLKKLFADLKK